MRIRPYLVLALLWLLYFHPLVLRPAHTLFAPYSDFLAEHLPAKLFLNREWRATGALPLWNPYHFCGVPFVHDIQVGAFYPPNAVVYLVPGRAVGAALSWVIALHVLAAGIFAYLYARARGLGELGGVVAATGFMLSSKWMTHLLLAGHTVTIGLAWLPLLLLAIERAVARRSARGAVCAGAVVALLGLGTHPQWAFYAVLFALVWTFPAGLAARKPWLACWAGAGAVAFLLGAVQVLPTLEAAQFSARSGGLDAQGTLSVGIGTLFALVGPSRAYSPPHSWEMQGVFGLFWLGAACAAPLLGATRARWQFGVLCGLFAFALGGAVLVEWLPGFDLFRVPTRMLVVAAFPLAFLAGTSADAVARAAWSADARLALSRGFRRAVYFAGLPTILGLAFSAGEVSREFVAYWLAALVSLPLFVRVLQQGRTSPHARVALLGAILLADLVAPTARYVAVRPQAELHPTSPLLEYLAARPEPVRVLDWDVGQNGADSSVLGTGAPQALVRGVATPRGYNPLDVRHYREFLALILNDPGPLRGNGPYTQQVIPNFEVGNDTLFRLLAVTHRVAPPGAYAPPGEWKVLLTDPAPPAPPPLAPGSPNPLPPHALTEAAPAPPRAWVVPRAAPLPEDMADALAALKRADFARTVFLTNAASTAHAGPAPGAARIVEYRANRVTVELDGSAGWLVLSDVWFPGWTCHIDGAEVPVERANHAFRAVPVPAGAKVAVFTFAPRSYRAGWWVSAAALALVLAFGAWCAARPTPRAGAG
ncbi:MAG: hypothetical protein FJ304_00230 [Planctomycetes bacterium]|nr:hypothetical protein [Planctomycetota bacterium]